MRHGISQRRLGRPTQHRMDMLRNLVSSLLENERITTTVAKAKETQRLAEKVITMGKLGKAKRLEEASKIIYKKQLIEPLFTTFAQRYAHRAGGYTRLHLAGNRIGDNAPLAVLEMVDNPHDIKYDLTVKTVARYIAIKANETKNRRTWEEFEASVLGQKPKNLSDKEAIRYEQRVVKRLMRYDLFEPVTQRHIGQVLAGPIACYNPSSPANTHEIDEEDATSLPKKIATAPTAIFLEKCREQFLFKLAELTLAKVPTVSTTQIVQPAERRNIEKGPTKPQRIVPMEGRRPKAGESTRGWESSIETPETRHSPIARAKAIDPVWDYARGFYKKKQNAQKENRRD